MGLTFWADTRDFKAREIGSHSSDSSGGGLGYSGDRPDPSPSRGGGCQPGRSGITGTPRHPASRPAAQARPGAGAKQAAQGAAGVRRHVGANAGSIPTAANVTWPARPSQPRSLVQPFVSRNRPGASEVDPGGQADWGRSFASSKPRHPLIYPRPRVPMVTISVMQK